MDKIKTPVTVKKTVFSGTIDVEMFDANLRYIVGKSFININQSLTEPLEMVPLQRYKADLTQIAATLNEKGEAATMVHALILMVHRSATNHKGKFVDCDVPCCRIARRLIEGADTDMAKYFDDARVNYEAYARGQIANNAALKAKVGQHERVIEAIVDELESQQYHDAEAMARAALGGKLSGSRPRITSFEELQRVVGLRLEQAEKDKRGSINIQFDLAGKDGQDETA